jgi:hypothetical protein
MDKNRDLGPGRMGLVLGELSLGKSRGSGSIGSIKV